MKTYNISLWDKFDFDHDAFANLLNSFEHNSIVNIFCAEEYEIKLDDGLRGWELLRKSEVRKKNINLNFVFGSASLNYYKKKYTNKINLKTELWPTFFINRSAYYLEKINLQQKTELKYFFICMNNLPRHHRCFLFDTIFRLRLDSISALTWHQPDTEYSWQYWKPEQLLLSDRTYINHSMSNQMDKNLVSSIHGVPEEFFSSLFSVVSESSVEHIFITEKTAIPLLLGQPFLIQGAVGFHNYLKILGFELYDEIFNYDFDSEPDHQKRTLMMLDNLEFLKTKDYKDLYNKTYQKAVRNRKRAIEISKDNTLIPNTVLTNHYARSVYNRELYNIR